MSNELEFEQSYNDNLEAYLALPCPRSGMIIDKCPLIFHMLTHFGSKGDVLKLVAKPGSEKLVIAGLLSMLCPIMDAGYDEGNTAADLRFLLREVRYLLKQLPLVDLDAMAMIQNEMKGISPFSWVLLRGTLSEIARHADGKDWHYTVQLADDKHVSIDVADGPDPRGDLVS